MNEQNNSLREEKMPDRPGVFRFKTKLESGRKSGIVQKIKQIPLRLITSVTAGILLIMFVSSLNGPELQSPQLQEQLKLARHKYEEGEALLELNKIRSRRVLQEGKQVLEETLTQLEEGQEDYRKVKELLNQVEKTYQLASAEYNVNPNLYYDLTLIRDNLTGKNMVIHGNQLNILGSNPSIYAVLTLDSKAKEVITGGAWLQTAAFIAANKENHFLYLPGKGVAKASSGKDPVIKEQENEIVDLEVFGSYLYLLRRDGEVLKYVPTEKGYSGRTYIPSDMLTEADSMAIDGAIWIISRGRIFKFIQGRRESFSLNGFEDNLDKGTQIIKSQSLKNLYLYRPGKNKIIVFKDNGDYLAQYSWEEPRQTTAAAVSEEENRVFLLSGSNIYAFPLK